MSGPATHQRTPEHLQLETGAEVGHYGVVDHLSTTGMSVVYAAVNLTTENPVALKLPLTENHAERLRDEIVFHGRYSNHPSVVTMDGCGVWNEQPFLATSFQPRGTLADEIETTGAAASRSNEAADSGVSTWARKIISELEQEIFEEDTYVIDEIARNEGQVGQGELRQVVRILSHEDIAGLVAESHDIRAESVVGVVAEAAGKHGHWLDPEGPLAKQATKLLLELEMLKEDTAAEIVDVPDTETIQKRLKALGGVASAAAALHEDGVVHRDIKLDNVALGAEDQGLLLDFGIARRSHTDKSGKIMGSRGNIPPEAYRGHIMPAGDVYALSRAAYVALTGEEPYEVGKDDLQNYNKILNSRILSARERNREVPVDVDRIILQGLSKQPAIRSSAARMAQVFELHS